MKPSVHHTVASATETIAQLGSASQFGGLLMPTADSHLSHSPICGVYSQVQISAIAADGTTYGAKNTSRKNQRPRLSRSVKMASTRARATSGGVVSNVNSTVCHIDCQKSELVSACV